MITQNNISVNSVPEDSTESEGIIMAALRFVLALLFCIVILYIYIQKQGQGFHGFDFAETFVALMFAIFTKPAILELKISCLMENLNYEWCYVQ